MDQGGPPNRDPRRRASKILHELKIFGIVVLVLSAIAAIAFGICLATLDLG